MIADNINDYPILDNLLGFHRWLENKVGGIYNNIACTELHKISGFVHVTFAHNFFACYNILLALERNLIHPVRALKRNVLESIVTMNYMAYFPNDTWLILFRDHISGTREKVERRHKLNELQHISYFHNKTLCYLLKKTERKYYFKWLVKKVYRESTAQSMFNVHQAMSHSAHASLLRPQKNYEKQAVSLEISDLKLLLFYNILAEVEGHRHMLSQNIFPYSETKKFIDKMLIQIRTNGGIPSLFPDHPNIVSKVCIHPPGQPWE